MEGKADYDRASRSPAAATFTCFLLFWSLVYTLGPLASQGAGANQQYNEKTLIRSTNLSTYYTLSDQSAIGAVVREAVRPTSSLRDATGAEKPNVAGLGEALYTDHLVTVELAGSLLFVALIAAVAITNPRRPIRPGDPAPVVGAGTGR